MSRSRPVICVFAGSSMPNDPALIKIAQQLGRQIADENLELMYGGGLNGLMGEVAKEAFNGDAKIHAVVSAQFQDEEQLPELMPVIVKDEAARFRRFAREENLAGYVVLPGGMGTLNLTALAIKNAKDDNGPSVLLTKVPQLVGIKDYFKQAVQSGAVDQQQQNVLRDWTPGHSLRAALGIKAPYGYTPGVGSHTG